MGSLEIREAVPGEPDPREVPIDHSVALRATAGSGCRGDVADDVVTDLAMRHIAAIQRRPGDVVHIVVRDQTLAHLGDGDPAQRGTGHLVADELGPSDVREQALAAARDATASYDAPRSPGRVPHLDPLGVGALELDHAVGHGRRSVGDFHPVHRRAAHGDPVERHAVHIHHRDAVLAAHDRHVADGRAVGRDHDR
jgi:hypothetical protein